MFCEPGPPSSAPVPASSSSPPSRAPPIAPSPPRSSSSGMTSLMRATVSGMDALDTFGRPLRDLRISVTDRCNFRCVYCMPKEVFGRGYRFMDRKELLTFEELERLARAFADLGVEKIRITGGEPLLRRDLEHLIERFAAIDDLDLTLTTNGALLPQKAAALAAAGLRRVTVSLDSLEDE